MNGSGKQSFYEIQLNNGSLIAAFLVAVALGVAVFMLGVMVGRGQVATVGAADGGLVEDLGTAEADLGGERSDPEFFEKVQETDETADQASATQTAATTDPPAGNEVEERDATVPTTPVAGEAAGLPTHDPALAEGFVIQVKSTPDRSDADALQGALAEAGYPAWVIAGDVRGGTTYRVRVGRYRTEEEAQVVERALQGRNDIQDTWVTRG